MKNQDLSKWVDEMSQEELKEFAKLGIEIALEMVERAAKAFEAAMKHKLKNN